MCNIKILENGIKTPSSPYKIIDVEKRIIPIQNLIERMKEYDKKSKEPRTLAEYSKQYQILLDAYRKEVSSLEREGIKWKYYFLQVRRWK